MRSFVKIKSSRNGEITLSFTDVGKSCPSRDLFNVANMSFNANRSNKILAKISEFTIIEEAGSNRKLAMYCILASNRGRSTYL